LSVYGHLLPRNRRGEVDCLDDAAPAGTPVAPNEEDDILCEDEGPDNQLDYRALSQLRGEDLNLRPSGYELG
jgi:hypothetical protein